ncbi:uncharacterized protein LOC135395963 [Ornithodoros turicata]|uniref:uncharacterized protein LOC135395963 n=1 Tax=Ornithodoros turicata TaxID=34597 RepID=UPI0031396E5B
MEYDKSFTKVSRRSSEFPAQGNRRQIPASVTECEEGDTLNQVARISSISALVTSIGQCHVTAPVELLVVSRGTYCPPYTREGLIEPIRSRSHLEKDPGRRKKKKAANYTFVVVAPGLGRGCPVKVCHSGVARPSPQVLQGILRSPSSSASFHRATPTRTASRTSGDKKEQLLGRPTD